MTFPSSTPETPASERHAFQPFSLVAGLITLAVAALFLIDDVDLIDVDGTVAGAVLLLVAGAAIVVKTALGLLRRR